jgi:hypothetical protein
VVETQSLCAKLVALLQLPAATKPESGDEENAE